MRLAFNTVIRSFRVWHVAPLLLPFLLGSAALQVSPSPNSGASPFHHIFVEPLAVFISTNIRLAESDLKRTFSALPIKTLLTTLRTSEAKNSVQTSTPASIPLGSGSDRAKTCPNASPSFATHSHSRSSGDRFKNPHHCHFRYRDCH
jgi:hypothetical protein